MAGARVRVKTARWSIFATALCLLPVTAVFAQAPPWHQEGWTARAIVEIAEETTATDTCGVKVLCLGLARANGEDYRVVDAGGNEARFQLTYHDPQRYSLISFQVTDAKKPYFIYYGNPNAARSDRQIVVDPKPGTGPPTGEWIPKTGLVLTTVSRPHVANPETPAEMVPLFEADAMKFGAGYRQGIADGYNPFGPSDMYLSAYRGWIHVPVPGEYSFCTVSNEASFSFLDGQELVHWPGRHTTERGKRGEKNAKVTLSQGPHYIEYYHEEVFLQQMAFLGWRPPNAEGKGYAAIPESAFPLPHKGVVSRYETRAGNSEPVDLPTFEPQLVDSIWPRNRHQGQYTRYRFTCPVAENSPTEYRYSWDFGDGQTAENAVVEHVFLAPGLYPVTLTVQSPGGALSAQWPLLVYDIQHITDQVPEGTVREYAEMVFPYNLNTLGALQLKEFAHLMAESDALQETLKAGKLFVERFSEANPEWVPDVERLIAECALRGGDEGVDEAIAGYRAAIAAETSPLRKLDSIAKLIQLVGVERGRLQEAEALHAEANAVIQNAEMDEALLDAHRGVLIAAGDAYLWNQRPEDAQSFYRKAEALNTNPIPPQVRAARTGAYPESVAQYLLEENYGAALEVIDRWEETFPSEKLSGRPLFWHGKTLVLSGQPQQALGLLKVSVQVGIGAEFETEARWLLAKSLDALGRPDEAQRELAALVDIGMNGLYSQKAKEALRISSEAKGGSNE